MVNEHQDMESVECQNLLDQKRVKFINDQCRIQHLTMEHFCRSARIQGVFFVHLEIDYISWQVHRNYNLKTEVHLNGHHYVPCAANLYLMKLCSYMGDKSFNHSPKLKAKAPANHQAETSEGRHPSLR